MWTPKYINIKNLFAHVDSHYDFTQGVCTVIFGENRDDDDSDNNGAGKSTLFEAIAIALTGKSLRDIDKEVFINRQANDCEVEFYLENSALNSTLGIIRKFYRGGKSAKVEVYEDGVQNTQLVSVNEANARIIDLIGISREDLIRYFIISQDNRYQFFTAGDSEKKEVLNRITNADMINPILEKLNSEKKDLAARSNDLSVQIKTYEDKVDFYQEQRQQALNSDNSEEITECQNQITDYRKRIATSKQREEQLQKDLGNFEKSEAYQTAHEVDVTELLEKKNKIRKTIKKLEEQESESASIVKHLKSDISGAVECPECGHKFMLESNYEISVDEAKKMLKEAEGVLSQTQADISKRRSRLTAVNKEIDEAEGKNETYQRLRSKRSKFLSDIKSEQDNQTRYNKRIAELNQEIKRIESRKQNTQQIQSLDAKIKEFEEKRKTAKQQFDELSEQIEMVDFWIYYMGKSGFMTYLANRAIKIVEGITNSFLHRFHSSMSVEINGFRVNKDGSVREKIDVLAVYKGKYAQNFMGYSGGERGRIYLASILGIQHLINLSSNGRGLDLLILDESLGALDARGVVNICNILNNLGVTTLMITQNVSNDVNVAHKVLVVREDEVSRIEL